jgi:gas vesicle protein
MITSTESEDVVKEDTGGSGNLTGFIVGAVVGAAVGAGVALLLAPRTGKETRSLLASKTREIKDRAASALEQARETVRRESKGAAAQAMKEVASVHELVR